MKLSAKDNVNQKNKYSLSTKMAIALLSGALVGTLLLITRESLISSENEHIWSFINKIFFQDISTEEGKNAIGIFYILSQLFINSLQFIIVPMIFSSIALICGYIAYNLGAFNVSVSGNSSIEASTASNPLMILIDSVPNNIFTVFSTNSRVLAVVFLAVVTGLCINTLGDKILVLKNLLIDLNNIITVFLNFVINKFSTIAIFVLITRTFAIYGVEHLKPAFAYLVTVTIAIIISLIVLYTSFIYIKTKLNPLIFIKKMYKVALLGFSAASSAAALSLNKKTAVEELVVDEDIASFILPLGMTINMNGTAIMQVIGSIFIAASSGYNVKLQDMILISILALIASIGTPSAPGSSIIILFTIITGMGYNNEATLIVYALIIAINRPMDMLATSLNVLGDAATAVVVSHSEKSLKTEIYNC